MIKTIAFDADDTLWVNETIFTSTREKIERILGDYILDDELERALYEQEVKNLRIFGYGIKGFMLSTIETCIRITNEKVSANAIREIIDLGKDMLDHPVELLPDIEDILRHLQGQYQLMIITKGDLFDQESKIARSGLADYFDMIEVVSEKNEYIYKNLLNRYDINASNFLMVGNSLKSDVLPVCNIGARAIHIPFHTTWEHEMVSDEHSAAKNYETMDSVKELKRYLSELQNA